MQAMPHSFRALADRVGEVADLLSHAQADLPNWWKGPAAQQAAASLGRAAVEAREFHDSAIGAATAVSRCAQVVAEQQNQMTNVPDVHEPGISAVVQRPTTPLEALEAARQDATYQAAHEQAVQVVNGIAAQYVETRSQLSNIGAFRTENFIPASASPEVSKANAETVFEGSSHSTENDAIEARQFSQPKYATRTLSSNTGQSIPEKVLTSPPERTSRYAPDETKSQLDAVLPLEIFAHKAGEHGASTSSTTTSPSRDSSALRKQGTAVDADDTKHSTIGINPLIDEAEPATGLYRDQKATSTLPNPWTTSKEVENKAKVENGKLAPREEDGRYKRNDGSPPTPLEPVHVEAPNDQMPDLPRRQPDYQPQENSINDERAAVLPPVSSPGPAYRAREERGRRPAYLKERRSEWLTETVAAPPDGVITPDWPEHR